MSSSLSFFQPGRLWMLVTVLIATTTPWMLTAALTTTTITSKPTKRVRRTATATSLRARACTFSNQPQHQQSLQCKSNTHSTRQYATRRNQHGQTSTTALSAATSTARTTTTNTAGTWTSELGDSALRNVQALASKVATAATSTTTSTSTSSSSIFVSIPGTGGESNPMIRSGDRVQSALQSLEQDSECSLSFLKADVPLDILLQF